MMRRLYWLFAYLGLMSVSAAFFYGFRYDPGAPPSNFLFNTVLYGAFIAIHLVMTRPWFKRAVVGKPEGSLEERRIYIAVSVVTWLLIVAFHRPVPGAAWNAPPWVQLLGLCLMLLGVFAFFEYANFSMMNGFLGVPGAQMTHSTGSETPLLTEGSYADVRHPMYRSFVLLVFSSLLVHANAAQLLWAVFVAATFLGFIPVEEKQLLAARGEEYRAYMQRTPYRVFRGLW